MNTTATATPLLLTKGLEEEVYTGSPQGEAIGLSHRIAADLPGFATEPDARNVEFTTAPYREYRLLLDRLMTKRCRLRRYLKELGNLTLVPGATLSLANDEFHISNPANPYYCHIRDTYGTKVVTASTHINVGISNDEQLLRAYRVLRCEAAIYLALTASSPFLDGQATGAHSTRWLVFPQTPARVPFFPDHPSFVAWMEEQLALKTMFNPRHLWLSVRPNGADTPYEVTRLEIRICDRIAVPRHLGAIVALAEARVWQILENPELDPLHRYSDDELRALVAANEQAAARASLAGRGHDWQSGTEASFTEWARRIYDSARETARDHGFLEFLEPLEEILEEGNLAQKWLRRFEQGQSVSAILTDSIRELDEIDNSYDPDCPSPTDYLPAL